MPYISNKRPKPKPPQNNVMTISKALKAVNDNMDWTVLFIALLLVMGCSLPPLGGIGACYQHIIHLLNQPNDPLQVASLQGYLLPKKAHPMQYHLKR